MIRSYTISDEAAKLIISESANHFPNETGGILVGQTEGSRVSIQRATGAGPGAYHSPGRFKRDGDFSQEVLDALVRELRGEFDYVGEWHSHPAHSTPSSTDIKSMKWVATNPKYATTEPLMLLCTSVGMNSWQLRCYCFTRNGLKLLKSIT